MGNALKEESLLNMAEFVKHGCLELLLAIAQLSRELVGLIHVPYQLVLSSLDTKICTKKK